MLVLVINYTGDRIHFGLAVERARKEGIKVRRVTIYKDKAAFLYLSSYECVCGWLMIFYVSF